MENLRHKPCIDNVPIPLSLTAMAKNVKNPEGIEALVLEHVPALFQAARSGPHAALVSLRRLVMAARAVSPALAEALTRKVNEAGAIDSTRRAEAVLDPTPAPSSGAMQTPTGLPVGTSPVEPLDCSNVPSPVLSTRVARIVDEFVREHDHEDRLRAAGLSPRSTMLLIGPPGVGKTMLASWIAHCLRVPLVQIQLSVAISSYLGKTGSNIKEAIDWARRERVVLLFDEFDALAKRRDDATDLGELKRVVSVLLKELEEWRGPSVIIAATNHPALIDPAIFRRFDLSVTIENPDRAQTEAILRQHLGGAVSDDQAIGFAADLLQGSSGSALRQLAERIRRQLILDSGADPDHLLLKQLGERITDRKTRRRFVHRYREVYPRATLQEIADLLGVGVATVHRDITQISGEGSDG